jgi:hypothetical protein
VSLRSGLLVFLSACASTTAAPSDPSSVADAGPSDAQPIDGAASGDAAAEPSFPPGVYYAEPNGNQWGAVIRHLEGKLTISPALNGIGFDLNAHTLVSTDNESTLTFTSPTGKTHALVLKGLYGVVRPSLSPDGQFVAVQATDIPVSPQAAPEFFTVYRVNVTTGDWIQLAKPNTNPMTGNELPEWFPDGQRLSHWGIESDCHVLRILDLAGKTPAVTIRNGGPTGCFQPTSQSGPRFHMTVSADSQKLLSAGQLQVFNTQTGALLSDIRTQAITALTGAGYAIDTRYEGQGGGGTCPLDATFSPDASEIVFDGAVSKNGTYGVILCSIRADCTGFQVLKGPIAVNPEFSNDHNFSQLTPTWKSWTK